MIEMFSFTKPHLSDVVFSQFQVTQDTPCVLELATGQHRVLYNVVFLVKAEFMYGPLAF